MEGGVEDDAWRRIKWNGWGAKHVQMKLREDNPSMAVHTTGKLLPSLVPFIKAELHGNPNSSQPLRKTPSLALDEVIAKMPRPVINKPFLTDLRKALHQNQIALGPDARLSHAVGKNYRDLWRVRNGLLQRLPDCIVLPNSHADVVKIVDAAHRHNVTLIPFGGGTNVVGCIEPDPAETERMVVSLDMRRMCKMKGIDKDSWMASFEAGVAGPDLEEQLARHGMTLGHDPDSHLYSTLGGWIATRSSGAQSNRYGEVEDFVVSLRIVTPRGEVVTNSYPRPTGINLNEIFIGSEGCLGVITEAVVKVQRLPEVKHTEGWLMPTWEKGVSCFREATHNDIHPATMRLYDDDETRLSFAMKFQAGVVQTLISKGIKGFASHFKGMDLDKVCLVIVGYEGTREDVAHQRKRLKRHFKSYGALCLGPSPGKNWLEKKYDLPYIRDFTLDNGLWSDVLETSTDYTHAIPLWRDVKEAVHGVWRQQGKRGWIGCHMAHQYKTGTCLYFTFAAEQVDERDIGERFLPLKAAATEAVLKNKGALTHHHGIGYEYVPWVERVAGKVGTHLMQVIKAAMDPKGICNPGKLLPVADSPDKTEAENQERKVAEMMFHKMGVMEHLFPNDAVAPRKSKL
eukprot:TRINITY_DN17191_c0_g1_i1.p1 TRINITY_DN17191_c0_g1~~TRINITY_DN17191_c0_g1_i1.p1  ORF type:complete len:626 (+),score=183.15 TRINITY_DN17191_c0_g1_i1:51-1928(+)